MTDAAVIECDGQRVEISNPGKLLFAADAINKLELARYYARIAPVMLPQVRGRPLTLRRFPDGIDGEGFFQKNRPDHYPDWIESRVLPKEGGQVDHVLANDAATLVYLAGQAMIEPHAGLSKVDDIDHPDLVVFDLDPSDDDFSKVRRAALALETMIGELDLVPFVKTTGSRGLHVVIPILSGPGFERVRAFARVLAGQLVGKAPDEYTVEQRKNRRGNRVFVDTLRNAYGQSAVAAYGVRALPGAPVAAPLDWHEVRDSNLTPRSFDTRNIFRRLGQKECPWKGMDSQARDPGYALDTLEV